MFGFLKRLFGGGTKEVQKTTSPITTTNNVVKVDGQVILDCKNLNCPMPIVNISKKIKEMEINQTLEISATDPAFKADLEAWLRKTGNELVSFEDKDVKVAIIKKIKA